MGFLDDLKAKGKELGDKAAATASDLAEKGKDAVEISKINVKISEQEKAVKDLKLQLGEIVWARFTAGELTNEDAKVVCDKIAEAVKAIDDFKAEIERIKAEPSKTPEEAPKE